MASEGRLDPIRHCPRPRRPAHGRRLASLVAFVALALGVPSTAQEIGRGSKAGHVWLDAQGRPLPFQGNTEIEEYLRIGRQEGTILVQRGWDRDTGHFVPLTIFTDIRPQHRLAQEEIFGPVLAVLPHDGDDDAVRIANNSIYGLSGAVSSGDLERALAVARRIRSGTLSVNGAQWFDVDTPFGGYRQSGVGRENGLLGFEEYLETKVMAVPPGKRAGEAGAA